DGEEADLERSGAWSGQDAGFAQAGGNGKRRLVVAADHADDAAVADDDEVSVLMVELVDEPAVARVGGLGDFADKGPVIETVDLFEFGRGFRSLEDVRSNA